MIAKRFAGNHPTTTSLLTLSPRHTAGLCVESATADFVAERHSAQGFNPSALSHTRHATALCHSIRILIAPLTDTTATPPVAPSAGGQ